jgi:hypothetical protein
LGQTRKTSLKPPRKILLLNRSQVNVLVHMISDTNSFLVIVRHASMSLRGVLTAKQSQSEIPRFRSEQDCHASLAMTRKYFLVL